MAQMTITQFMTGIKNWVLGKIGNITSLIPPQASSSNQLADKAFVNSSIATATATFRGTYNVVSDLSLSYNATHAQIQTALATKMSALSITPDNNDYAFVQIPTADATPTQIAKIERYKYSGSAWAFEYELNNSGFTAAQWAAINSGITGTKVTKLDALPTNAELTALLAGKQNVLTFDNAPTENSNNPVKSGGIYTAIVNTIAAIRSWALGLFARKDGSYDTLSAGSAKDLEGDVVDNNTFLFRKSGGLTSVAKGNALVNTIKGNTVAWNQLMPALNADNYNINKATSTFSNGVLSMTATAQFGKLFRKRPELASGMYIPNRKYIIISEIKTTSNAIIVGIANGVGSTLVGARTNGTNSWERISRWFTAPATGLGNYFTFTVIDSRSSDWDEVQVRNIQCFDLTLIFGAGNEPTSVEAFESWLAQNIGLKDYYPYNAGELISCNMQGIKTVGFNLWDEEWEVGSIDLEGGWNYEDNTRIRSKNFVKCLPKTNYYGKNCFICWYDINKKATGSYLGVPNSVGKSPSNAYYMRMETSRSYGNIYKNDICINISDTDKNGTYEPYWTETKDFDVKKVYGKLNGEGESVVVFPDGMKKAGSVYDEIVRRGDKTYAIKRVGNQTIQTSDIAGAGIAQGHGVQRVYTNSGLFTGIKYEAVFNTILRTICSKISGAARYNDTYWITENEYAIGDGRFVCSISGLNTVEGLSAICPFDIFYELAESLTYTDLVYRDNGVDVPLEGINYKVDTLGTEEIVVPEPPSGADADIVTSCAPTMAIIYGMNAVKTIQNLNSNFVSPKQVQTFTDAEKTQARSNIGAASLSDVRAMFASLPTTDPQTAGSLWNDNGVVKISVGGEE